ncbi:receptor kinase-like protein Xa21 [Selaginella moellendorffii]|uniref:receptor kinase-like protein Xa21 n=1 Tax=Selaginella moellendorffii TaxID=88036 RepID=UPI000D1C5554|nr:receptor kinase-like protein Xa21 [Selaginella moellendorffii]|eukprot:XP_024541294.1 receptor kinase-like protein Xa21 [Selaginella moellendorffii]
MRLVYSANMEHLTVASNRFSGPIPGTMGNLTRLLTLSLAVNNFSGSLPQEIGNLSSLTELLVLDVGRDQNVVLMPSVMQVTWRKRTEKSFARTAAVAEPPELTKKRLSRDERVALVKSFVEKCLDSTGLGGELPPALSSLRGLQTLNMFDSNFNGSILDFLANMSSFEILAMYGNKLSGLLAASLANLTNLRELEREKYQPEAQYRLATISNKAASRQPFLLAVSIYFGCFTRTLRNCQLSGFIPDLGNLTQLTHLHLSFNNLTGTIPAYISSFDRLSRLNATIIGNPFSVNRTQGYGSLRVQHHVFIADKMRILLRVYMIYQTAAITLDGTDFNIDMPSSLDGDYYSTGGWVSSSSGFAESFQDNRPLISAIQVLPGKC